VCLPTEIRFQIYELIAFTWAPRQKWPMLHTWSGPLRDSVPVARRNPKPFFEPARSRAPLDMSPEDRARATNEREFDQKGGMLDNFKTSVYQFLEEFIDALWKFEGRGRAIDKWYVCNSEHSIP
jgi:hypothetical protein